MSKKESISLLENATVFLLGIFALFLPLAISSLTTDSFVLPKQILLLATVTLCLIFLGLRMILAGKLILRQTPFGLPLLLLTLVLFLSSLLAVNRIDSLTAFVPFFLSVLLYFVIVNSTWKQSTLNFLLLCLVFGAAIAGVLSTLSFFHIYLFPFPYTKNPLFNTFGSLFDETIYLVVAASATGYLVSPLLSRFSLAKHNPFRQRAEETPLSVAIVASLCLLVIGISIGTLTYQLLTTQKPLVLPFETGFQTAFATISQDTPRVFKSFFLGSGYGTFATDFTRFKQASYNANSSLWAISFFRSSSFVLEMLATTGILGTSLLFFLFYRIYQEKSFFLPLVLLVIISFLLPFSFPLLVLFMFSLGIFTSFRALSDPKRFSELELSLIALKRGFWPGGHEGREEQYYATFLPALFTLLLLVVTGFIAWYGLRFVLSDYTMQRSFAAANQSNGSLVYKQQAQAINTFPYRDSYYRVFSQTNLALAQSLLAAQPKNSSPSAQVQQDVLRLVQQAISSARSATALSPQTALNWNNLAGIYRSLIGFGQNADQFAILTSQQAITLDPNNPQQYVNLGGIFYQLKQYDEAIRQFQLAIQLKPDYANAYYNLGHALQEKGDLKNALVAYKTVANLVANDKTNSQKIKNEIAALEQQIGKQQSQTTPPPTQQTNTKQSLNLNTPQTQLPEKKPQIPLPSPVVTSPQPTPTPKK